MTNISDAYARNRAYKSPTNFFSTDQKNDAGTSIFDTLSKERLLISHKAVRMYSRSQDRRKLNKSYNELILNKTNISDKKKQINYNVLKNDILHTELNRGATKAPEELDDDERMLQYLDKTKHDINNRIVFYNEKIKVPNGDKNKSLFQAKKKKKNKEKQE